MVTFDVSSHESENEIWFDGKKLAVVILTIHTMILSPGNETNPNHKNWKLQTHILDFILAIANYKNWSSIFPDDMHGKGPKPVLSI